MTLPPYRPDTPEVRRDWANYHDQVTAMDRQVGKFLADLEKDGLHENTLVFYFSDHAGPLPRGKRNIHDSGTRIPFIVRTPERWAQWAPTRPGGWVEDPVALIDLPPTLFSLCGIETPSYYEGVPFLGPKRAAARGFVYQYRDRMGERSDVSRSIRDAEFRYVRNFAPHRPWGQHCDYAFAWPMTRTKCEISPATPRRRRGSPRCV